MLFCFICLLRVLSAGWYVLIDNHLNSDGTILDSSTQWLAYWKRIMEAIAADPVSVKFVMYDILNEPDSRVRNICSQEAPPLFPPSPHPRVPSCAVFSALPVAWSSFPRLSRDG